MGFFEEVAPTTMTVTAFWQFSDIKEYNEEEQQQKEYHSEMKSVSNLQ